MLFKLTVLAFIGLVACQTLDPAPDGDCPATNDPLTHLPDKNSCVYFYVCWNGKPLLMPRCPTGMIWDGTRCRTGVCSDLPDATTTVTTIPGATTTSLEVTSETAETASVNVPTAPVIPPTAVTLP